ncbi:hypothetical protein [Halomicronema sp. CCY15110]|uniref:hypothetical protein n=1 Tax=Halomicronema sp. CCY15110 TaxID=2767773 RepID=UPI00195297EC|nr:hypothetical protein [Halomicronema sp. CCY15110]
MNLQNVLWSTRGEDWGFRFLLHPNINVASRNWLEIYEEVFKYKQVSVSDYTCRGKINLLENRSFFYVAFIFTDPERRKDRSGRVIPHELVYFDAEYLEVEFDDFNLKNRIWNMVSDTYSTLYPLPANEMNSKKVVVDGEAPLIIQVDSDFLFSESNDKRRISVPIKISVILVIIVLVTTVVFAFKYFTSQPEVESSQILIEQNSDIETESYSYLGGGDLQP